MQQTASATPSRQERRVRRTRAMILAGFIQLMQQKPVKDISVRELADLVDINRSTFYLHYTDIYDLLEQTENGLMDQFLAIIDKNRTSLTLQEFSDKLEQFFTILSENQPLCRALMSPNGDIAFVRKLEKNHPQTTAINLCKLLSFHAVISSIFFKICNCNFPQAVL